MRGEFGFGQKVIHDGEKDHVNFFDVFMVVGFGRNVVQGWREIGLLALARRIEDVGHERYAFTVETFNHGGVLEEFGEGDFAGAWWF